MNCTIDSCGKEAEYTFVWPWGAEGACCQFHVGVVQQKAKNARGKFGMVSFTRLNPDRPRELTRDERVELHTARLVAESEKADAQLRATKLFDANTQITNERNALRARVSQFEANARELVADRDAAIRERDAALVALDAAREEAERLGVSLGDESLRDRKTPPEGFDLERPPGLEAPPPTHVVEGSPPRDEHGRFSPKE